ncbi:hematopoietic SH2 domain-containing protein homolog [Stegastes partitus]|uniref:Hematopoietic SH2 domain-containing protein homolog n=1 Tax=Stegastes partitus TaxID=144197 RepID=A0A9Y4NAX7_9TELE|nr:PREDICTED: hematopoietic SH2 domain-containing protein [Stegastes partitus]
MSKPPGYFLIRVSESRIGYTLSYRAGDRCRHFMIDALEDGQYIILGENRRHRHLQDLVDFHRRTPIMPFSQVLTVACGQSSNNSIDYAELLFPQRQPPANTRLLPTNPPSTTPLAPPLQDIPPAIPYRPNNLTDPTVPLQNRLYPCLEDGFGHASAPRPATPVPKTRKRYEASSNQPPEVPSRSCVPVKQNQACIRTVSAPESPSTPTAAQQPVRNPEAKPSVLTNLKKKFQKNRSSSQDNTYAEVNVEAADGSRTTESEYQEISGDRAVMGSPFSYTCPDVRLTDEVFPQEYLKPPPFAPGY